MTGASVLGADSLVADPPDARRRSDGRAGCRLVERVQECSDLLEEARAAGMTVGLVPTMGALHAGHRSLIERAGAECDLVVVTVFVNPLQFGDPDDIEQYPRTLTADVGPPRRRAPPWSSPRRSGRCTRGSPPRWRPGCRSPGSADRWEGASRPGHFDGVATVVVKLFAMAGRCRAYFGEKDFQQMAVVRRLVADLSLPVEVVGCPTVREEDGLALSSRNVRLSADERRAAPVLARALRAGAAAIAYGEYRSDVVGRVMAQVVAEEPLVELDYAEVVAADDLDPSVPIGSGRPLRLLIAARVGPVRLIDNLDPGLPPDPGSPPKGSH